MLAARPALFPAPPPAVCKQAQRIAQAGSHRKFRAQLALAHNFEDMVWRRARTAPLAHRLLPSLLRLPHRGQLGGLKLGRLQEVAWSKKESAQAFINKGPGRGAGRSRGRASSSVSKPSCRMAAMSVNAERRRSIDWGRSNSSLKFLARSSQCSVHSALRVTASRQAHAHHAAHARLQLRVRIAVASSAAQIE